MSITVPSGQSNLMGSVYDWSRFWIPQTGTLDLSDAGFLRDPENSLYALGPLRTLAQLQVRPALALLGEPGIGKSATLGQEHARIAALSPEQKIRSVYVNMNGTSSEDRLRERIFESPQVETWKAADTRLYLHLDSLDEAMLRIETVPHLLADGLRDLPTERLSVRIACRTAVWPDATLGGRLKEIWRVPGLDVLELCPLRRDDVRVALAANGIDPDEFISSLFATQAVAFAIKPLTVDFH
jgi:hypothetical protein